MAKWSPIAAEPFYSNPIQLQFLADRRLRYCLICTTDVDNPYTFSCPPTVACPKCGAKGVRVYDRLTIIAGRRFGKTRIGAIAGAEEATVPGTIGWACAPTNDKLHRYVIPAFRQIIPLDWCKPNGWSLEHHDLELRNGSLIHFQTLEDPDQGRGQGLDWLWIDEVSELTKAHWDVIRPSLAGDTTAFFTTSPRGYDWAYDELVAPAERGVPGYRRYLAKTSESSNPRISTDFLAREKAQMSDEMYRQEYEADFVIFQGAVYGGAVDPQILKTKEAIQHFIPEWPDCSPWRQVLVGLDTGADHPFGALKIISTERGLIVVDEYLERGKSFVEHCGALKRMANNSNTRWALNKNEKQAMIEFAQPPNNITNLFAAENDIIAGTERVKNWLHSRQLYFIEEKVPQTIKQMKSYRWAENYTPKDQQKRPQEKVYKKNDELPDSLRYALMSWPQLPTIMLDPEQKRDISALPKETQITILRERKAEDMYQDREKEITTPTTAEDFWA